MFRSIPMPPHRKRPTAPASVPTVTHAAELLTAEKLRELLTYCLESGIFRRRVSAGRARAGDIAGRVNPTKGYLRICINGKDYAAHRLAWLYVYGVWPSAEIDHINRVKTDNRIDNLTEATRTENNRNKGKSKNNTSGHVGVSWDKTKQKWYAYIQHDSKRIHLGYYDVLEDAVAARRAGELLYWGAARTE